MPLVFSRKQGLASVPLDFDEMVGRMIGMLRRTFGGTSEIETIAGKKRPGGRGRVDAPPLDISTRVRENHCPKTRNST